MRGAREGGAGLVWSRSDWLEIISPCVVALGDLQKALNDTLGGDQGTKHAPPDLKADIESLMNSLDENDIYRIKKGRMVKEEDIVKDVVAVGLQNLTSGEKNPISDYNTALTRLQMRRKMNPVSLTLLQEQSAGPIPRPQTPPSRSPMTMEIQPSLPTIEMDEDDVVEELATEQVSEVEQILQDLANGVVDETLPRLTEEDVAFDMDEVVVEEEEVIDDDDSDTDEEKSDIGWIDAEEEE